MAWVEARPNGTFRAVWREKGKKESRTFATEDEAILYAADPIATGGSRRIGVSPFIEALVGTRRTPTVAEYGRPLVEDAILKLSSRDIYRKAFRKIHGSPLGEMEIGKVTPADVRAFRKKFMSVQLQWKR